MSPKNATEIGNRRWYECPKHGTRYISVTTALGRSHEWGLPAGYAAKMTAERAFDTADEWLSWERDAALRYLKKAHTERRDTAADAGTAVHEAAERILSGTDWRDDCPDELHPIAERIERWWQASGGKVLLLERTVWHHTIQYAGTFDAIIRLDHQTLILDYKTSGFEDLAKWRLQLAAYADAEEWTNESGEFAPLPAIDGGVVFWVPRDDPAKWHLRRVDIGIETAAAFRSVLHGWRYFEEAKKAEGPIVAQGEGA